MLNVSTESLRLDSKFCNRSLLAKLSKAFVIALFKDNTLFLPHFSFVATQRYPLVSVRY